MSATSHLTFKEAMLHPEIWGRWVESAVGSHLLNRSVSDGAKLFYWRERNDEVDFVFQSRGKTMAIEVKSSSGTGKKGMDVFQKKFSPDTLLLVGKGGMPVGQFLKINPVELI